MTMTQVELYVMDIMVIGVRNVGKSTFLRAFTQPNTDADGWNTGSINVSDEVDAQFIEPPPSYSANYMWMHDLIEESDPHGFIVMCDSTRPECFSETIGILQTVRRIHPETPCVLVANKQDDPYAWSVDDIRLGYNIANDIVILPCVANNHKSVRNVVIELLTAIWNT